MTRRSVRSFDPALDEALASLPKETQERLNILRLRLLLAPDIKRYLHREPDPPSKNEMEALGQLERALLRRESEE